MKTTQFEQYLLDIVAGSGIDSVETFGEAGVTAFRNGVQVSFTSGARALLQIVRTSPPGTPPAGYVAEPRPRPRTEEPSFIEGGRVDVKTFAMWLAARILNGGNPDVWDARVFHGVSHRVGVDVTVRDGAHVYVYVPYVLRPGQSRGEHVMYGVPDAV